MIGKLCGLVVVAGCLMICGCRVLSIGAEGEPPHVKSGGILTSYAALNGFRSPDKGKIIEVGILDGGQPWGDIVSVDVWPFVGVGVSFVGARVKILPFEFGFGVLGYKPEPEDYWTGKEPVPEPKPEPQPPPAPEPR